MRSESELTLRRTESSASVSPPASAPRADAFPDGDAKELLGLGRQWSHFVWYTGDDLSAKSGTYGKLAWCRDAASTGNGVVENGFELLASWFDATGDKRRW